MTSGKLKPKPDDSHRKQLTRRAKEHISLANRIIPDRLKKTPSQKKSESAKKHEQKRAEKHEISSTTAAKNLVFDCYTCPEYPCGTDPVACDKQMILERCARCGQPVRHYIDKNFKWTCCKGCRKKVSETSQEPEVVKR